MKQQIEVIKYVQLRHHILELKQFSAQQASEFPH